MSDEMSDITTDAFNVIVNYDEETIRQMGTVAMRECIHTMILKGQEEGYLIPDVGLESFESDVANEGRSPLVALDYEVLLRGLIHWALLSQRAPGGYRRNPELILSLDYIHRQTNLVTGAFIPPPNTPTYIRIEENEDDAQPIVHSQASSTPSSFSSRIDTFLQGIPSNSEDIVSQAVFTEGVKILSCLLYTSDAADE